MRRGRLREAVFAFLVLIAFGGLRLPSLADESTAALEANARPTKTVPRIPGI